eukprot:GEMP01072484.1.p1 GENE.GEMP01072484.1~~GEMP01072484.1.p1  ORF type:complete len:245 (+),score=29.18 GEMP01072484.1:231-965(+)
MTIAECDADLDTDDSDTPRQGDVYWALSVLFLLVLIAFLAMFVIDTNQTMRFLLKLAGNRPSSGTLIGWMLLTIAVVVSCVPVWSLMLMAQGFIFELRVALATNFVALVAAAVISYGIGKNFGDPVRRLFKRHFPNGHQFAKAMVAKGLWHLLVFRFAWVAMGARNYLPVLFKFRGIILGQLSVGKAVDGMRIDCWYDTDHSPCMRGIFQYCGPRCKRAHAVDYGMQRAQAVDCRGRHVMSACH